MNYWLFQRAKLTIGLIAILLLCLSNVAQAAPTMASPAGLSLIELKVTGDEFMLLQNNTQSTITDLNSYWLTAYNNVSPLASGVASSSQQLPASVLLPGQTLLLSSGAMQTCGASVAGKLSVSLSDGGGFLQLMQYGLNDQGAVAQYAGDWVSWSSGQSGVIQNVPSSTKDPRAVYYRFQNGVSYAWQLANVDPQNNCQLTIVVAGGSGSSSAVTPLTLAATSPPATILGTATAGANGESMPQLPAADVGLAAPQLSELLPNPTGTGNDSSDEFIELYNPNDKPFDLTGFILQTGTTTTREYVFLEGTLLEPKGFKAFYAKDTKLTLSNTTGQANLFDPFGNAISGAATYSKAKDGITWAVAKGVWYWTTQATPGAANVIKQPTVKPGVKTTKTVTKNSATGGKPSANTTTASFEEADSKSPIHGWVLALIAGGALLYGAYEYRHDVANRLFQLRAKLGFGGAARTTTKGGRSD